MGGEEEKPRSEEIGSDSGGGKVDCEDVGVRRELEAKKAGKGVT